MLQVSNIKIWKKVRNQLPLLNIQQMFQGEHVLDVFSDVRHVVPLQTCHV